MSLHQFLNTRNLEHIRAAIAAGADVNELHHGSASVLEKAAAFKDVELLRVLLDSGADPNLGRTPPLANAIVHRPSAELLVESSEFHSPPSTHRKSSARRALLKRGADSSSSPSKRAPTSTRCWRRS